MIVIKLDIDMPKECHECPFQLKFKDDQQDNWYSRRCVIEKRIIEYPRPKWCPLKERNEDDSEELKKAEERIEWYRARAIEILDKLSYHDCNSCAKRDSCEYVPQLGDQTRANCPLWKEKKRKEG